MPFFSIIIPIYNVEEYLPACLDSVIYQSFKEIEIILINDGSTDKSTEIAREYAKKDSRILLIEQENQGLSIARNIGLKRASGDYIIFVDSDDFISINLCQELHNILQCDKIEVLRFQAFNFMPLYIPPSDQGIFNGIAYAKQHLGVLYMGCAWLYVVKRKFLISHQITFIPNIFYEDMTFIMELFLKSESFFMSNLRGYYYRIRKNSITQSKMNEIKIQKSIDSYFAILDFMQNYQNKETHPDKKKILQDQLPNYIHLIHTACQKASKTFKESIYLRLEEWYQEHQVSPIPYSPTSIFLSSCLQSCLRLYFKIQRKYPLLFCIIKPFCKALIFIYRQIKKIKITIRQYLRKR